MNWGEYFMGMAQYVATKSKDPSTKVGAVITTADNRVISVGFNGPPRCAFDNPNYSREVRLMRTLHAEENAALFARRDLTGCTIYCTHHPCAHCAAVLIQVGILRVVCPPVPPEFAERWGESVEQAQKMFRETGTILIPHV